MSSKRVFRVRSGDQAELDLFHAGIQQIQEELDVTADFSAEVEEAARAAAASPRLPELDRTELPFVTIDPDGAMDLDQAVHIERGGDGGYVVHYAIADVMAFLTPGDPVDVESHERGETLYGADRKVPLHPTSLSEDAASLLPDQVRPALLWTVQVDETGEGIDVVVERALVRSTAKLSYPEAQQQIDGGNASETLQLLKEVGELRLARDAGRGGISLPLPEQEIDMHEGHWELEFREQLPVEEWNAQISLLTGFGAASLMVYGRVGFLRTLPPPDPADVKRLHRTARALGIEWPAEQLAPDFVRTLDPRKPNHAAMVVACTRLLRGSGYVAFNGEVPAEPQHAALASEYAHVTAPLRRLADRYASEICLSLCSGDEVPDWVLTGLDGLAKTMQSSGHKARAYENAVFNLVEAGLLSDRVGETFDGVVVSVDEKDPREGTISIAEPGVEGPVSSSAELPLGTDVSVTLVAADVAKRSVQFRLEG